jgi:hypothetical protein
MRFSPLCRRIKNEDPDCCCSDSRDEHGTCRDIFAFRDQRMEVGAGHIGKKFERGIQGFGCPDGGDGQYDPTPIGGREFEEEPKEQDSNCCHSVDPSVVLGSDH